MKRRNFVKTTLAASSLTSISALASAATIQKKPNQEYYELRRYFIPTRAKQQIVNDFLQNTLLPAYKKININRTGVFTVAPESGKPADFSMYMVIPFTNMNDYVSAATRLSNDTAYAKSAEKYLNAPMTDPPYDRIESSLLLAFEQMPTMKLPEKKERIFELRRYESHNEKAAKQKVKMFNAGEIDIFNKTGLTPVFFGETLIGPHRPNLTYMLTFPDISSRQDSWSAFQKHPDWLKLKEEKEYADTVSKIESTILKPTPYSQV